MKVDNLVWANSIIQFKYPDWMGIDLRINQLIDKYLADDSVALDVGCGKHGPLTDYKTRLKLLVGTDLGLEDLKYNTGVQSVAVANGEDLPFPSAAFDLLLSKTVIEHVLDPLRFFREAFRVLKPGGVFIWATSNLRSLPIMISRLTPLGVHKWVYRRIFGKQLAIDQFPTYYRANTEKALERQLARAGFTSVAFHKASWPQYFAFSRLAFQLFLPLHQFNDRLGLDLLQVHLIGVYRKEMP